MTIRELIEKLEKLEDDEREIFVAFGDYFAGIDIVDIEDNYCSVHLIIKEEDVLEAVEYIETTEYRLKED